MILLIDNYDSFVYNLYQMLGEIQPDIIVARNDQITTEEIHKMNPEKIVLSPGPGRPGDAGICIQVVKEFAGKIPILGVCLGHQAIYEAFKGTVTYADKLMHGKQSTIQILNDCVLFEQLEEPIKVARYHSLIGKPDTLPEELEITAQTPQGEIMAVQHREYKVYGLQFHPESILTPQGKRMLKNFIHI